MGLLFLHAPGIMQDPPPAPSRLPLAQGRGKLASFLFYHLSWRVDFQVTYWAQPQCSGRQDLFILVVLGKGMLRTTETTPKLHAGVERRLEMDNHCSSHRLP